MSLMRKIRETESALRRHKQGLSDALEEIEAINIALRMRYAANPMKDSFQIGDTVYAIDDVPIYYGGPTKKWDMLTAGTPLEVVDIEIKEGLPEIIVRGNLQDTAAVTFDVICENITTCEALTDGHITD